VPLMRPTVHMLSEWNWIVSKRKRETDSTMALYTFASPAKLICLE